MVWQTFSNEWSLDREKAGNGLGEYASLPVRVFALPCKSAGGFEIQWTRQRHRRIFLMNGQISPWRHHILWLIKPSWFQP